MRFPLRAVGVALICAHLAVASTPCGGARTAAGRAAEAHEHAVAASHGHAAPASHEHAAPASHEHAVGASHEHAVAATRGNVDRSIHGPPAHGRTARSVPAHAVRDPGSASSDGASSDAVVWRAVCPCGCDRGPGARVPGRGLDPALRLADAPRPAALVLPAPAPAAPRPATVFPGGPEPVPRSV
jgi:hypothetical protein